MHIKNYGGASVLAALRSQLPDRPLRLRDALIIAERQAETLLQLRDISAVPVPTTIVTDLPRIVAEYDPALPRHAASGASDWDAARRTWVIAINPDEPFTRQRFTVLHEYKHIIDHGHAGLTGFLPNTIYGLAPVEYLAEYFAGCVLMPQRLMKRAFYDGIQQPGDLAQLFDVSTRAVEVRLQQLNLVGDSSPTTQPDRSYRLQPAARQRLHRYLRLAPRAARSAA